MLLCNFLHCSNEVKCKLFESFCKIMYCCLHWFNSTSSSVKKIKCSFNSVLHRLLSIRMPCNASEMFVTHGIPFFMSYSLNVSTFLCNVLAAETLLLIANSMYFPTNKTLVAISIILILVNII